MEWWVPAVGRRREDTVLLCVSSTTFPSTCNHSTDPVIGICNLPNVGAGAGESLGAQAEVLQVDAERQPWCKLVGRVGQHRAGVIGGGGGHGEVEGEVLDPPQVEEDVPVQGNRVRDQVQMKRGCS